MIFAYKSLDDQSLSTRRFQEQSNDIFSRENEMAQNVETEDIDVNICFDQIDDQIYILKGNINNYTNEDFLKSLVFFEKSTCNLDFIIIFGEKKNEQFLELLNILIELLNQHSNQLIIDVSAIHTLNNILLRNIDHQKKNCFEVTEALLNVLYEILDYYLTLFFGILSSEYTPMLFECFKLMKKLFILTSVFFDRKSISEFPDFYKISIRNTIDNIKKIILVENIDPCILEKAFSNLSKLLQQESSICYTFVEEGFIPICFDFMKAQNPAFCKIVDFLGNVSRNFMLAIDCFPPQYPEIFQSFLVPDFSDDIIESILVLIGNICLSQVVAKKIIALDGFLENLLNLDKSFRIRILSLDLFNSLIINHFNDMEYFFLEHPDFNIFLDYLETNDQDIIYVSLSIICQITQYICYKNSQELPNYIISLILSRELLDKIYSIHLSKEYKQENNEAATLALSGIEHLIDKYNIDTDFDYDIKYDNDS